MYTTLAILASVFIIFTLIRTFLNRNWTLIYSAFGHEEYFRTIAKLKTAGMRYKIETPFRSQDSRAERFKDNTQYDIFVKKDDEQRAIKALHEYPHA